MNTKSSLSAVVEAKSEYTKLLFSYLRPLIYEALVVVYSSSVENAADVNSIIGLFHNELANIRKWNNEVIKNETERIREGCPFLDDLVTAVILANVKILTSIRTKKNTKQLKITVPSTVNFIHSIYINVGKEITNNPDSFDIEIYNGDITRNYVVVACLIDLSIETAIRSAIPLRHILDMSLPNKNEESESESESDHEPMTHDHEPDHEPMTHEPDLGPDPDPMTHEPDLGPDPMTHEPDPGPDPGPDPNPMTHEPEPMSNTMMNGILCHSDDEDDVKEVPINHSQPIRKQTFF
jgi:hypothetical protein